MNGYVIESDDENENECSRDNTNQSLIYKLTKN